MKKRYIILIILSLFPIWIIYLSLSNYFHYNYSKKDAKYYLPGIYYYINPTKELQILKIDSNFKFQQILYLKDRKTILSENKIGLCYPNASDLKLNYWKEFYESGTKNLMKKPLTFIDYSVFWRKPKDRGYFYDKNVMILFFPDEDYIFRKISKKQLDSILNK